jgi:hypothetical protein
MSVNPVASRLIAQETRALLTRLARVKPFVLHETMVPAAAASLQAQVAIERYLLYGRRELRRLAMNFLNWLHGPQGQNASPERQQRGFTLLRLRFNLMLSQFDIFADVMTQRSEHETGVWLSGLDAVAADALALPDYYDPPPVVCYLDRGHGAAIRRARTRLPGGGENPVAIIRVPRERMVGSGVSSSLVHEVGHQGVALLGLVESLRPLLRGMQRSRGGAPSAWVLWERWISEIVADFWSVAKVGVASTLGLMGVVSLPRAFVFRVNLDDPHPIPWVRVKLSCAMGEALYPHPQWQMLARVWESYYPKADLDVQRQSLLATLEDSMPSFVSLLAHHRPRSLRGKSLMEVMGDPDRQPARLREYFDAWQAGKRQMRDLPPSLTFAVIGQARADGKMSPEQESRLLGNLLTQWALRSTLSSSEICAKRPARLALAA